MFENIREWLTIHGVARDIGVELTNEQGWEVGARLARNHHLDQGTLPMKDLRPKKSGTGSHCLAIYPPHYRKYIEDTIRAVQPSLARQLDMFINTPAIKD